MSNNSNFYSNNPQYQGGVNESTYYGPYGGSSIGGQQSRVGGGGASTGTSGSDDWFTPSTTSSGYSAGGMQSSNLNQGSGTGSTSGGYHPYMANSSSGGVGQQNPFGYSTGTSAPYPASGTSGNMSGPYSSSPLSGGDLIGPMGASQQIRATPSSGGMLHPQEIDFENEPPLMEELGIHIPQIIEKTKAVILPFGRTSSIDTHLMDDDDLAGPLVYALLLGGELLLSAKISFGYIYGFGMFGCLAMTLVINLMSPKTDAVSLWRVTSILGYCLLPVNFLAAWNCILFLKYRRLLGLTLAGITVLWCTVASTRLFERSCGMRDQRYLIAYPIALLYTSFVMITIF